MIRWITLIVLFIFPIIAQAHEVRPVFLSLTETQKGEWDLQWKQPVINGKRLKIKPILPDGCNEIHPHDLRITGGIALEYWSVRCPLSQGEIYLEGLERTLTDGYIQIIPLAGPRLSALLKPANPRFNLEAETNALPLLDYLRSGIDHILGGWDHLLFVIGLVLLVKRRQLIGVATAFTLAHSITLALAVFGLISLPGRPVEILIAASLVLLAVEIIKNNNGHHTLSAQRPYLISFAVGLIHGCGFASALADVGLPDGLQAYALALFNLGVELGQISVIVVIILGLWGMSKISPILPVKTRKIMTYMIGGIGMFWMIERLSIYAIV